MHASRIIRFRTCGWKRAQCLNATSFQYLKLTSTSASTAVELMAMKFDASSIMKRLPRHVFLNSWDLDASLTWIPPIISSSVDATKESEIVSERCIQLDNDSRHVIQLLQELHINQQPVTFDIITTERCFQVLTRILRTINDKVEMSGRAERAHAILSCMQLFEKDDLHLRRLYLPPFPTRKVYFTALRIYAGIGCPEKAIETVRHMNSIYTKGNIEIKPTKADFNCVLLAYLACTQWDKVNHAAKFFLEHVNEMDNSCYVTLLRMCASNTSNEKSKELRTKVAVIIWEATVENKGTDELNDGVPVVAPDFTSHVYAFFLQCFRNLPLNTHKRNKYFEAVLKRAILKGKVNTVILQEFLVHNTSVELYSTYIGRHFDKRWQKLSSEEAAQYLMKRIPVSWCNRADIRR